MKHVIRWILPGLLWAHAVAVEPVRVLVEGYDDFSHGSCRSTSLDDRGTLREAPALRKVGETKPSQIWSVVADRGDALWLGTGPSGELLKMQANGTAETVCKFNETHLYAMTRTPDGTLFIGTSPDGKIYRLDKANKPQVYFEPKEKYIWALVSDPKGVLYAATGTEGRIYRITGEGKGEVYFDSDEVHLRSLALDREGRLLAGSADSGILYRITAKDQGVALASTGRQEINQIVVQPDGTIYFTATGQGKGSAAKSVFPAAGGGAATGLRSLQLTVDNDEGNKPGPGPNLQPQLGRNGFNSLLCRVDKNGFTQALFGTPETLLSLASVGDQIWAGSGVNGNIYAVDAQGHVARLLKIEAESPTVMLRASDGVAWIAASNPGSVWKLGGNRIEAGVYESDVIDSGSFARWGSVRAGGHGGITLRTRSGNTPKPDKSWNAWMELTSGQSRSPAARYAQFEIRLQDGEVTSAEFFFLPRNLAPHVSELIVLPSGLGYSPLFQPAPPAQPKTIEQLVMEKGRIDADGQMHQPVRYQPVEKRGLRTVVWKAEDPNDDTLQFTLYCRAEGFKSWQVLGKGLDSPLFSWDTTGWPEGHYELRVLASDAPSNAKGQELIGEETSRVLVIDNTPPRVQILRTAADSVEFQVTEETGTITSVRVSNDGQNYTPAQPADGIADARSERFVVPYDGKQPLFIRAEDDSGNVGGASVSVRP